jgi:hypothetical protein
MGGGNKVDVVTSNLLQVEHHTGQVFITNFPPPSLMGYGPVLTENATQVTVGEKNGSGSVAAHQGDFFAVMWMGGIHHQFGRGTAETLLAIPAVDAAPSRTEFALLKDGIGPLNPLGQFAFRL